MPAGVRPPPSASPSQVSECSPGANAFVGRDFTSLPATSNIWIRTSAASGSRNDTVLLALNGLGYGAGTRKVKVSGCGTWSSGGVPDTPVIENERDAGADARRPPSASSATTRQ